MKPKFLVFMAFLIILGCTANDVRFERLDTRYYEYPTQRMTGNTLTVVPPAPDLSVELNAEKFRPEKGEVYYNLIVEYSSNEWLFIQRGESLILTVDGEQIGFRGEGSSPHRETSRGGRITEKAWYTISFERLQQIANAERVRVRILGSQRHIDRSFSERNFENFRHFITKYGI